MEFEFHSRKSESNKKKHGIDFSEAEELWSDPDRIEIPACTADEPRYLVVAKIAGEYWSAIVTYRGQNTRIISVRRWRREEVDLYEGEGDC
jgi:hypothetical protein